MRRLIVLNFLPNVRHALHGVQWRGVFKLATPEELGVAAPPWTETTHVLTFQTVQLLVWLTKSL
jgi:hypothetical protein